MGCEIVAVHRDNGISVAKGRNGRPGFDALCKAANRREFDIIMAWSVDRLAGAASGWSVMFRKETGQPSPSLPACVIIG
jgi:DNA invertase Pin-like site-specific DNA recombinase